MKKVIVFTISLCLVFGSVFPVYAATQQTQLIEFYDQSTHTSTNAKSWADSVLTQISSVATRIYNCYTRLGTIATALTDNSNSYILTNMLTSIQKLTHIADQFDTFLGSDGTTTITENWSEFTEDMYKLVRFLAPVSGSLPGSGNSFMTLWDYTFFVAGRVADLWGGWDGYFSHLTTLPTIQTYTNDIRVGISNVYRAAAEMTLTQRQNNAHQTLVDEYGRYDIPRFAADGTPTDNFSFKWNYGSPIGNLALILRYSIGQTNSLLSKTVAHFNDNLTTWEHNGYTQTSFTPVSAINGLYRYLAYIQSDSAHIDYELTDALTNEYLAQTAWTTYMKQRNSHSYLLDSNGYYTMSYYNNHGMPGSSGENILWSNGTPIGNLAVIMRFGQQQTNKLLSFITGNFDATQNIRSWSSANANGILATSTYTPDSSISGVYKWLQNIQEPLAQLAFVHADQNDVKLKVQEASMDQAVTNNFFGSGSAAASPTDIADITSASAGFKTNFNSGVSSSNIWTVFGNDRYNWFTQNTKNQLDTTPQTRGANNDYPTPLLDNYYAEMAKLFLDDGDER